MNGDTQCTVVRISVDQQLEGDQQMFVVVIVPSELYPAGNVEAGSPNVTLFTIADDIEDGEINFIDDSVTVQACFLTQMLLFLWRVSFYRLMSLQECKSFVCC